MVVVLFNQHFLLINEFINPFIKFSKKAFIMVGWCNDSILMT